MNQPIRPFPFARPGEQEPVEGASLFPPSPSASKKPASGFDDLLDSEISDEQPGSKEAQENKKRSTDDPWTHFGHVQSLAQFLQEPPTQPAVVPAASDTFLLADESALTDQPSTPANTAGIPGVPKEESATEQLSESLVQPGQSLLETLRPAAQQKVPPSIPSEVPHTEQFAGKPPEPAKKISGIPAAQAPPMLSASQNQEESAQKQNLVISDDDFQVSSFESSVQVRASLPPSESAPKRELAAPEPREFASVEAVTPEWSSFEGISDSLDIQAPKSVDSIEVAEAIRTHVELLRSSGQGKLDVVLRPDGHTELRLQVEKVNGQILVQARCDRGDFVRLEANWSAVQQSLAQQGVRVEALQNGAAFQQHGWNDSSRSSHQHDGSPREHEPKFIDLERPVPNRPKKPATSSGSARGWQSWA